MLRAAHFGAGVDCGRVLCGWDVDMAYRIADLLLEDRLRLPGHASLRASLHQEKRRLSMVDMCENRAAIGDLRLVDGRGQCVAAGLLQRGLDLTGDTFELRIRHGQTKVWSPQIREALDVARIARR